MKLKEVQIKSAPNVILFSSKSDFILLAGDSFVSRYLASDLKLELNETTKFNPVAGELIDSDSKAIFASESGLWTSSLNFLLNTSSLVTIGNFTAVKHLPFRKETVAGLKDGSLILISQSATERNFDKIHDQPIRGLVATLDSKFLFSGSEDRKIIKWDIECLRPIQIVTLEFKVSALHLRPGSKQLLVGTQVGKQYTCAISDLTKQGEPLKPHGNVISLIVEMDDGQILSAAVDMRVVFQIPYAETIFWSPAKPVYGFGEKNLLAVACEIEQKPSLVVYSLDSKQIEFQVRKIKKELESLDFKSELVRNSFVEILSRNLKCASSSEISLDFFKGSVIKAKPSGLCTTFLEKTLIEKSRKVKGMKEGVCTWTLPEFSISRIYKNNHLVSNQVRVRLFESGDVAVGFLPELSKDPLADLLISQFKKGNVTYIFSEPKNMVLSNLYGDCIVKFLNASLKGYIFRGELVMRKGVSTTINFGNKIEVVNWISDSSIMKTNDGNSYKLSYSTGFVERVFSL